MSTQPHNQGKEAWKDFIEGSEKAFELVYNLYNKHMYRYGFLYSNKIELIEDAIHDVFLQIYKIRKKLPKEINPKTYLFIAMRNTLLNTYKSKEISIDLLQIDEINKIGMPNAEDEIILSEESQHITSQLAELQNGLTEKEKQALYYRLIENLSYADLAQIMNIKEQSAKNMVHRTINKMRALLKGLSVLLIHCILLKTIT